LNFFPAEAALLIKWDVVLSTVQDDFVAALLLGHLHQRIYQPAVAAKRVPQE
jgi:hypothetical protein